MQCCPRCGAEALYVGLQSIECGTPDCPNYRPVVKAEAESTHAAEDDPDELGYELWLQAYGFF